MLLAITLIIVVSIVMGFYLLNNDSEKSFTLSDWRFIESQRDRINGDSIIHKYYIKINSDGVNPTETNTDCFIFLKDVLSTRDFHLWGTVNQINPDVKYVWMDNDKLVVSYVD